MRNLLFSLALVVLVATFAFNANAQINVVIPNANTNVEGPSSSADPWYCDEFSDQQRYLQIYAAEEINAAGSITAIRFRPNGDTPAIMATVNNVQVDLSITDVDPEDFSNTFADNLGPVIQTVFQGNLLIDFPPCNAPPCAFDFVVPLDTPFPYNPAQGNIAMDVRMFDCPDLPGGQIFDAVLNIVGNTSTRGIFNPDNANGETGFEDTPVLVTEFVIAPPRNVPTLSQWGLIAMAGLLGVVGFVVIRRKQATA